MLPDEKEADRDQAGAKDHPAQPISVRLIKSLALRSWRVVFNVVALSAIFETEVSVQFEVDYC